MLRGAVHKNFFATGDCAAFMKLINGNSNLEKFVYKDLSAMVTIGRGKAVVNSLKIKGFLAWCAWMFVHLIRLAGAHTNFTVALKWT